MRTVLLLCVGLVSTAPMAHAGCLEPSVAPVARWALDGDALDASGNGHHGLPQGQPGYAAGQVVQGMTFDAVDDVVVVPAQPVLDITGDLTVAMWVKRRPGGGPEQLMVSKGVGIIPPEDDPSTYAVGLVDDALMASFETADGINIWLQGPPFTDMIGFHHVAYVREGLEHRLYVDGRLVASEAFPDPPGAAASYDLSIGAREDYYPGVYYRHFAGILDDIRLYDVALTADDVALLYEEGRRLCLTVEGTCPGPLVLSVEQATASGNVALAHAAQAGSAIVPSGPCAGTELGLAAPGLGALVTADDGGSARAAFEAPPAVCGRLVQAIDLRRCTVSEVVALQ